MIQNEKQFQDGIIHLAQMHGWLVYHTYDSRRCVPGFPDLFLTHPKRGEVIIAELKTDTGRLREAQKEWLDALSLAQQNIDSTCFHTCLWRPKDRDRIVALLKGDKL